MVDPAKIVAIANVEAPTNVHMLQFTPIQTGYYRRFIKGYTTITAPMEHSLNKTKDLPIFPSGCPRRLDILHSRQSLL